MLLSEVRKAVREIEESDDPDDRLAAELLKEKLNMDTMNCGFCGGPRLNGLPLIEEDGVWTPTRGIDIYTTPACRSCAKERLYQPVEAVE